MSGAAGLDFNGHGSWIGGNIAAEVDGNSVNGIAPGVSLVALKISQWCGSAFDSEIMSASSGRPSTASTWSASRSAATSTGPNPFQDAAYDLYGSVVEYATTRGTTIVASAGNEHAKIGTGGKVHQPRDPQLLRLAGDDLFGLYEVPGGIKGVVDVSVDGERRQRAVGDVPDDERQLQHDRGASLVQAD